MNKDIIHDIIGITDNGQPIVTTGYQCPHFISQSDSMIAIRECWYCKFADFRKTCDVMLKQSVCRCPLNRVKVIEQGKNEQKELLSPQIDEFVSNIKGGIITCIFDNETQTSKAVYINAGWTAITGYTLEALNDKVDGNPQALVYPADKAAADLEYRRQVQLRNEYALIYRVIHKDGHTIWVIDRGVVNTLPNGDIQNQSIVTEVTEIKEQEENLRRLAEIDQLTDLYNKITFTQQTELILSRQRHRLHAVLMLDIDNFKQVNDSMGHDYGDKVLTAVAYCLKGLFRNRDLLGRVGGDEFMVLMTDIHNPNIALQKANELCAAMHHIKIGGEQCTRFTISVGIAFSNGSDAYEAMFKQADTALYRAKSNGKNQACIF